jgi:flagellar assembly protein FliH
MLPPPFMSKASKDRLNVPPPSGVAKPSYGRFIPKEEIEQATAWKPDAFGGAASSRPPVSAPAPVEAKAPAPPPPPHPRELLAAARQAGYQDGLRDGQASADAFKQSHARQVAVQLGALLQSFDGTLGELETQMAQALTRSVVALAQQVIREELRQQPEHIARIAAEAVESLMMSARHVRVRLNPLDMPLVQMGAGEVLEARGASLLADPLIARGGCLVESDIANVDARIAQRWQAAAAQLGQRSEWKPETPPAAPAAAEDD